MPGMTKICRISPARCGTHDAWQVEIDDTCVSVSSSRAEALDMARRIVRMFEETGVPCEAVLSTDIRGVPFEVTLDQDGVRIDPRNRERDADEGAPEPDG